MFAHPSIVDRKLSVNLGCIWFGCNVTNLSVAIEICLNKNAKVVHGLDWTRLEVLGCK